MLGFYSSGCNNKVVFQDFNLESGNLTMMPLMECQNLKNSMKNYRSYKGVGSCIYMILTNRKYIFKHTTSFETGTSDYHYLIYAIMKATFETVRQKKGFFIVFIKTSPRKLQKRANRCLVEGARGGRGGGHRKPRVNKAKRQVIPQNY